MNKEMSVRMLPCPKRAIHGCSGHLWLTREGGIGIAFARFPKDYQLTGLMLATGLKCSLCTQTEELIDLEEYGTGLIGIFWEATAAEGVAFLPSYLVGAYPSLHTSMMDCLKEHSIDVASVKVVSNPRDFREQVSRLILAKCTAVLNSFGQARNDNALEFWVSRNIEKLEIDFFTAATFMVNGLLPGRIGVSSNPIDAHFRTVRDSVPEGVRMIEAEDQELVLSELKDRLDQIALLKLIFVLESFSRAKGPIDLDSFLLNYFPRELVDAELLGLVERFLPNEEDLSSNQYVLQAAYAALCLIAEVPNPKQDDWTNIYFWNEIARRAPAAEVDFSHLSFVSSEFAKVTVSPKALWSAGMRAGFEFLKTYQREFGEMARDLGLEGQFTEWFTQRVGFRIPNPRELNIETVAETVETIVEHVRRDPSRESLMDEVLRNAYRQIFKNLRSVDTYRLEQIAAYLRDRALSTENYDLAVWSTTLLTEQLNDRRLPGRSVAAIDALLEPLQDAPSSKGMLDDTAMPILMTELGNAQRYLGRLDSALETYDDIRGMLTGLPDDDDRVRTNEMNRAIVLRDLGRVVEAMSILENLLESSSYAKRINILHSMSICYALLHHRSQAIDLLIKIAREIEDDVSPPDEFRTPVAIACANAALERGEIRLATKILDKAIASAEAMKDDLWLGMLEASRLKIPGLASDKADASRHRALGHLGSALERNEVKSTPWLFLDAAAMHFEAAQDTELRIKAMQILEKIAIESQQWAPVNAANSLQSLGVCEFEEGAHQRSREHLLLALHIRQQHSSSIRELDPYSVFSNAASAQERLGALVLQSATDNPELSGDLQMVADLQSSPSFVLASSDNLDGNRLEEIVSLDNVVFLQFIRDETKVHLVVNELVHGKTNAALPGWSCDADRIDRLSRRVVGKLTHWSPAAKADPLDSESEWIEFAEGLLSSVRSCVPPAALLCIAPSHVSAMPLSYVFGNSFPFTLVPNIQTALALLARRVAPSLGIEWRPRNLTTFFVPKAGDSLQFVDSVASELENTASELLSCNVDHRWVLAEQGDQDALFAALETEEAVQIACHGRAPGRESGLELLIAYDNELPPSNPASLRSEEGKRFRLPWTDLYDLKASSPLVFSIACSSGYAERSAGGERIGLERPLFRSGAVSFVAPLWPVDAGPVARLYGRALAQYFRDSTRSLARCFFEEANSAIAHGMPKRVARAVAVHGCWL